MSETWPPMLTDNPNSFTLTPLVLAAALAFLRWDARRLEAVLAGRVKRIDIQNYMDYGLALGVCETSAIKKALCRRLSFGQERGPQGLFLKPETFGNAPGQGYIQFTDKPKKLRPAP